MLDLLLCGCVVEIFGITASQVFFVIVKSIPVSIRSVLDVDCMQPVLNHHSGDVSNFNEVLISESWVQAPLRNFILKLILLKFAVRLFRPDDTLQLNKGKPPSFVFE